MARVHGKNAYLALDGVDLSTFCDSAALGDSTDVAETTGFGDEAKTYIAGGDDATLSVSGRWDGQASEVQQIEAVGVVEDGTWTITFDGQETTALDHDDTAGTIEDALAALTNVEPGDLVVAGGPLPDTPVTITFAGAYIGEDVPLVEIDDASLAGGGTYAASVIARVGPNAVLTAVKGGKVAVPYVFGPEGNGAGKVRYSGTAILTSYAESAPVGDVVAFTAEFQVTGGNTPDTF